MTVDLVRGPWIAVVAAVLLAAAGCGRSELFPPQGIPPRDAGARDVPAETSALASLSLSAGALSPRFAPEQASYTVDIGFLVEATTVTAVPASPRAAMFLDGAPLGAGVPSAPLLLTAGTTRMALTVTAPGAPPATYTVTITRGTGLLQRAYVKASNTDAHDLFGGALALSGDTLVVGAPAESSAAAGVDPPDQGDNSLLGSGAVYIFTRSADGAWQQQAFLKASNPDADDKFGFAVALSGDTLAVGAPHESGGAGTGPSDNSLPHSGAVYVFARSASGKWKQEAILKASTPGVDDSFGCSVALSGGTLAAGAFQESSAERGVNPPLDHPNSVATAAGAVYVFTRTGDGAWAQQAYIKAANADANDLFGFTLALSDDTLAVGAEGESSAATGVNAPAAAQDDNSASFSGAAYVFQRSGETWTQQAYLKASNTDAQDLFGSSVALSGDTLAVGAPAEDSFAAGVDSIQTDNSVDSSGAVYVFTRSAGTTWKQQAYVKAFNTGRGDHFGTVALAGDILAVGAPAEDSSAKGVYGGPLNDDENAMNSGAVYLFLRSPGPTGAWTPRAYVKASNTGASDSFGFPLAIFGDTVAVGAAAEDSPAIGVNADGQMDDSATDSGAVYIFR